MPSASILFNRRFGSQVAGSTSARRGACRGGNSGHPAAAGPATAPTRLSPKNQQSVLDASSHLTWGTRSPHFFTETLEVHRSGASITWVSVSITLMVSVSDISANSLSWRFHTNDLARGR